MVHVDCGQSIFQKKKIENLMRCHFSEFYFFQFENWKININCVSIKAIMNFFISDRIISPM